MLVLLLFSFIVGFFTTLSPCIWPILPLVFSKSLDNKKSSISIILGILLTLLIVTFTGSSIIKTITFNQENRCLIASLVVGLLGITMLCPSIISKIEFYFSQLINRLGIKPKNDFDREKISFIEGFFMGCILGIIWTPCAVPIISSVIAFSLKTNRLIDTLLIDLFYVFGFSIPLLGIFFFGEKLVKKSRFVLIHHERIQKFIGLFMILVALSVCAHLDKYISSRLLDIFPSYSSFMSDLEKKKYIQEQIRNKNFR